MKRGQMRLMRPVLVGLGFCLAWLASVPDWWTNNPASWAINQGRAAPTPDFLNYEQPIPGTGVKFAMVAIRGGSFTMGSPIGELHRNKDEGPQRRVQVGPFWLGRCEVTWDEFDLWWKTKDQPPPLAHEAPASRADAITRPTMPYVVQTWGHGHKGYPTINITHHAAMEYCRWLSRKTGKTYRLPTEAEWEFACRSGTTSAFSFGDDPQRLKDHGWFEENAEDTTHPVGKKTPNAWGLHDMHGNVMEWCVDHYFPDAYSRGNIHGLLHLNPVFVPTAKRHAYVARGGSWTSKAIHCRSASRRGSDKSWARQDPMVPPSIWWLTDAEFIGFRVARPVEEIAALTDLRSKVLPESPNE